MTNKTPLMKLTARVSLVCFLLVSFQQAAMAGIVTTTEIVDQQVVQLNKQRITDLLSQQEVQSQLMALGVDPQDAKQRLANMTDEQVQAFADQMNEAPAGSGVVGTLAFIFIVLLITDLMGFTDVFPFVKKTVYD